MPELRQIRNVSKVINRDTGFALTNHPKSRLEARQYARAHPQQQQSAPDESSSANSQCISLQDLTFDVCTV